MVFWEAMLNQLGGNKFISMTGAKNFCKDTQKKALSFKIGKNSNKVNYIIIRLTPLDLYDMDFINLRGLKMVKKEIKGIYSDQLQEAFTENTGMDTHI